MAPPAPCTVPGRRPPDVLTPAITASAPAGHPATHSHCSPRGAHPFLHLSGQFTQIEITGHRFNPGIGDANEGLMHVGFGEPDAFHHRAGGRSIDAF
jgi:hypothetical protein